MRQITHYIDGQSHPATSGRTGVVWDPARGEQTSEVTFASVEDVDAAVASATRAFTEWRATSLSRRMEVMFRFRELLDANRKELASLVTSEHGKTLADALGEVARGIENVEYACGIPSLIKGSFSEQVATGVDVYSINQPLGVVAGVTPFNFPVMVPLWMLSNAVRAGNAFILKPSEKDPSAALLIADLLTQSGLRPGLFNVLQGDKVAVDRLIEHPDVAAISFVGSTPVARSIYETATSRGKRVQALGGAKNHMVVLPDADIGAAADAAISAGYGSAGERCMAVSVVVAVGAIGDELVEEIARRIPNVKVGAGDDAGTEMGPLVTKEHLERVTSYVEGAEREGASVVVDGRLATLPSDGFFLGPTLVDHVNTSMQVYQDEIFGPVLSVVRAADYDEAIKLVNENQWGNGVALFTRDGGAARRFQFDCSVGMVGINVPIPVPVSYYSFGGWKASLFGDLHIYGPDGVRFYTQSKVVTARWPDPASSKVALGFPQTTCA